VHLRLSIELAAVPESVPSARSAITGLCEQLGIEGPVVDDVRLAVTEACANAVLHGQAGDVANAIFALDAWPEDEALLVVVRDFGDGTVRGPPRVDGLGAGRRLIEQLAEQAQFASRPAAGMTVAMRFAFALA
jgi:serine/threonine-protein kinase RsbW